MSKGLFRKTIHGLSPHNQMGRDVMAKYALDDLVMVDVVKPRNLGHHRMYWALCQKVADNIDGEYSAELISDVLKLRSGHCTAVRTKSGEVFIPKSISFAAMDQLAFNEFFDRIVRVVCTEVLPGVNSDELREEIENMLGGSR